MPKFRKDWAMKVTIRKLDSGYVVARTEHNEFGEFENWHRTAETTLTGALGIAARALGYCGTIEFGSTARVPVVSEPADYAPPGVAFDPEEPPLRAGTVFINARALADDKL